MSSHWINTVFVNDQYYGGMWAEHLAETKRDWQLAALKKLNETSADHVVYCAVYYDNENRPIKADFYTVPLDDDEFYKRTEAVAKESNVFIGAVHKHK